MKEAWVIGDLAKIQLGSTIRRCDGRLKQTQRKKEEEKKENHLKSSSLAPINQPTPEVNLLLRAVVNRSVSTPTPNRTLSW